MPDSFYCADGLVVYRGKCVTVSSLPACMDVTDPTCDVLNMSPLAINQCFCTSTGGANCGAVTSNSWSGIRALQQTMVDLLRSDYAYPIYGGTLQRTYDATQTPLEVAAWDSIVANALYNVVCNTAFSGFAWGNNTMSNPNNGFYCTKVTVTAPVQPSPVAHATSCYTTATLAAIMPGSATACIDMNVTASPPPPVSTSPPPPSSTVTQLYAPRLFVAAPVECL
jgi:hypothetical protein